MAKKTTDKTKSTMAADVAQTLDPAPPAKGELGKMARKITTSAKARAKVAPVHADPRAELRRLVNDHKLLTMKAKSIAQMCMDRTVRMGPNKGATIPSGVSVDRKSEMIAVADALKKDATRLESLMTSELKKLPIFTLFLNHVFGMGPVVSAYLVALIDIMAAERMALSQHRGCDARIVTDDEVRAALAAGLPLRATKISNVRRFCGLAVINGRLERPTRGVKLGYCGELRTRLYQALSAMWKNSAKRYADRPNGSTSKYLEVWRGYKHRMQHSDRLDVARNVLRDDASDGKGRPGARGLIHAAGWHKAADVLIEDLYTVWRALEGLPVWPSYYAAKLGFNHGGSIAVNAPKMLTAEEALAVVGYVGASPAAAPVEDIEMPDEEDDGADVPEDIAAE